MVKERAKGMIGNPNPGWPPLKPKTIAHKGGLALPLLETGEMRDSIEHTVVDASQGWVGRMMSCLNSRRRGFAHRTIAASLRR